MRDFDAYSYELGSFAVTRQHGRATVGLYWLESPAKYRLLARFASTIEANVFLDILSGLTHVSPRGK